jgi:hypothetical protein
MGWHRVGLRYQSVPVLVGADYSRRLRERTMHVLPVDGTDLERIQFDISALVSLITALNRDRRSNAGQEIVMRDADRPAGILQDE